MKQQIFDCRVGSGNDHRPPALPLGKPGLRRLSPPLRGNSPRLWGCRYGTAVRLSPLRRGTPPATAWPSPLINAGGKNGAKRPRLPLWGSWHGAAVTEEAFPAAAGDSPCHCVALPPHKCGGKTGAKRPRLPLWGSWHGEAGTERAVPAAAGKLPLPLRGPPPS